jgi:hypothetical protein
VGTTRGDIDAVLTALPGVLSAASAAGLNAARR